MNLDRVEKVARAVLYEGYMLYPYRPSAVKNRQRWNFGVLYPPAYCASQTGSDAWNMQTECLVQGSSLTSLQVKVKFLQVVARSIGELPIPLRELPAGEIPAFHPVEKLEADGQIYQSWQEAVEREVCLPSHNLDDLSHCYFHFFDFPAQKDCEPIPESSGMITGVIVRERELLCGEVAVTAERLAHELFKVTVKIRNRTALESASAVSRENASLRSLVSTHTVLGVQEGKFVSSLDPPQHLRELATSCSNVGTWPVLVGEEGERDLMLSSPIILYDYPQIAPESCGDLFDGTEIDEILSLRIMTMTDEEKREMRNSDERSRQILERTETLPAEHLMKLHGVLRAMRPRKEDAP